jgi:hypothetical protein
MAVKNNRVREYQSPAPETSSSSDVKPPSAGELADLANRAKEWAGNHPLPCLATAFIAGVAIAWIIKRK